MKTRKNNKLHLEAEIIADLTPKTGSISLGCNSVYISRQGTICIGLVQKIYTKVVC